MLNPMSDTLAKAWTGGNRDEPLTSRAAQDATTVKGVRSNEMRHGI